MTEEIRAEIEQYLAGEMLPEEAESFLLRLRSDPAALAYLGRVLRQDALLFHLRQSEGRALREPSWHRGWLADIAESVQRVALAAAVVLAVTVGGWFAWRSLGKTSVPATLAVVRGDVFLDHGPQRVPQRAQAGQDLPPGSRLATSGPASGLVLALADGSRVEAFAETALQIGPAGDATLARLILEHGELEVMAAQQAPGHALVLETSQAETKVLGTRFRLASAGEATRLEVQEGAVQCRRKSDGATIEVGEQQQAVVRQDTVLVARPMRNRSGLLALYLFGGPDEWVRDRSGALPPADIRVGKAVWKAGGLSVALPAKFDAGALPGRVRDRIAQSQEFTLEFWVAWESAEAPLHHLVLTRSAAGAVELFQDGAAQATEGAARDLTGAVNFFLQELRRRQTEGRAKEITLKLVAIYDRALSPAEVRQNHQAGAD